MHPSSLLDQLRYARWDLTRFARKGELNVRSQLWLMPWLSSGLILFRFILLYVLKVECKAEHPAHLSRPTFVLWTWLG